MIGNGTMSDVYSNDKDAYKELLKLDKKEKLLAQDKKSLKALLKSGFLLQHGKKVIAKYIWVK